MRRRSTTAITARIIKRTTITPTVITVIIITDEAEFAAGDRAWSMIQKSGNRFSEKTMLNQNAQATADSS
jgi:hypothetical protein